MKLLEQAIRNVVIEAIGNETTTLIEGCQLLLEICGDWDVHDIIYNTGFGNKNAEEAYNVKLKVATLLKELNK